MARTLFRRRMYLISYLDSDLFLGQNPPTMETLLSEHAGPYFRGGFER